LPEEHESCLDSLGRGPTPKNAKKKRWREGGKKEKDYRFPRPGRGGNAKNGQTEADRGPFSFKGINRREMTWAMVNKKS